MLPKKERLSRSEEIKKVLDNKEIRTTTPLLTFIAKENFLDINRAAVICSKKVGNAVKRNRIRRKIVTAYQEIRHNIAKKFDIIFIARSNEAEKSGYLETIANCLRKNRLCEK